MNEIEENLQKKTSRASVLAQLRERKPEPRQQKSAKKQRHGKIIEWYEPKPEMITS